MSPDSPKLNVLVVGSGIAGPSFAFWLHKFLPSSNVTILERAPSPRLGGQAIDLRSASVPIVERMGLLQAVKDKTTTEVGMEFIYADGKTKATFPASGDPEQQSATSEFEILRGDMARILYDTTKNMEGINYIFDETITEVEETSDGKVNVTFANHLQPTTYDLVVGADGQMSRTRRLIFGRGPQNDDYLHRLGQYGAYFTIPRTKDDTTHAQWYNAPQGRLLLKRPDQYGTTQIYMAVTDSDLSRFDELDELLKAKSQEDQKAWFEKTFQGAGWQSERVVKGMKESKDFYMQQIAQVKMDAWSKGHVVLVGDAAYTPSPISGVGTGAAIVGAYVLAGEMSKSPTDILAALQRYDAATRPFVDKIQKLIPGAPQIANPQTAWGVAVFNTTVGVLAHPFTRRFGGLFGKFAPALGKSDWALPDYGEEGVQWKAKNEFSYRH